MNLTAHQTAALAHIAANTAPGGTIDASCREIGALTVRALQRMDLVVVSYEHGRRMVCLSARGEDLRGILALA